MREKEYKRRKKILDIFYQKITNNIKSSINPIWKIKKLK